MKTIDFRVRPPIGSFLKASMYLEGERRDARFTRNFGFEPAPSAQQKSMPLLLEEMRAGAVDQAVILARISERYGGVSNEEIAQIVARYPDRLIGVGVVNPTPRLEAIAQIEQAMKLGLKAINLEPGILPAPMYADDRRLYPIYAYCEDHGIPMVVMTGGNAGPDLSYSVPVQLDRVLADFPTLQVAVSHGNWPWVHEILHVAFRRPNLYVSVDMYLPNMPGMNEYLAAANGFLADRFIFGSNYPYNPVKEYAEWFRKLPLSAESMEKALYKNAARFLKL